MANNYRATFFFDAERFGWTETYFKTADNIDQVLSSALDLKALRGPLLGGRTTLTGLRVSDDAIFRDSLVNLSNPYVVGTTDDVDKSLSAKAPAADNPYSAVLVRCDSGPLYRKSIFLRGVPDAYIRFDTGFSPPKIWADRFKAFTNELKAPADGTGAWRFKVRSHEPTNPEIPILTVTLVGTVLRVLCTAAHGLTSGDAVLIRKARTTGFKINGRHIIDVIDAATFSIRGIHTDPEWVAGGIVRAERYIYVPITASQIIRQVSRRTGRPSDSPRGRRSVRR